MALKEKLDSTKRKIPLIHSVLLAGKDAIPGEAVLQRKWVGQGRVARYRRISSPRIAYRRTVLNTKRRISVILFDVLFLTVRKPTSLGWHVHHDEISTVFLNPYFDDELNVQWVNKCHKLQKSKYGLKQSLLL